MKIISIAVVAFAASCVASPEPQDPNGEFVVYTQTIVTHKEDGTLEVTSKPITLAEEIAEDKIREASATGKSVPVPYGFDPGCAGTSEWLYDQPGLVGNRICFNHPPFNGTGFNSEASDLAQFTRGAGLSCGGSIFPQRWAAGVIGCLPTFAANNTNFVRSIWTGVIPSDGGVTHPGGVVFRNDSPDGPVQGSYRGDFIQFPNVSTSGRYVVTFGTTLN